jgi:hypothetical protein
MMVGMLQFVSVKPRTYGRICEAKAGVTDEASAVRATNLASSFFDLDDFAALIVAALRAGTMRQFALVTIGTLGQRLGSQMIVGTTFGCARLRMTPFRIRHENLTNRIARTGPAIGNLAG